MAIRDIENSDLIVRYSSGDALSPFYAKVSVTANDALEHDFRIEAAGKANMTLFMDNRANQTVTVTIYGAHSPTSVVGDNDVVSIGSFTVGATSTDYETMSDVFPYYIARMEYATAPTDDPATTATLYISNLGN